MAMELPFILVASILVGGGLGYVLDKKLGTTPAFVLLLGILGFGAGMWDIIRRVKSVPK
ncbi:MAG TPA: AtpZ/AtpI family protein [Candidatus Acidoferrales bacterium]|nr:AtpZ/AtpI family protein [Candidatus Acidoferrales bacterium]